MPTKTVFETKIEHLQILDEHGKLDTKLAKDTLSDEDVVFLYEQMSTVRHYDEIAFKLQRSGRMGTYPQNKGQEACAAGPGFAIKQRGSKDWVIPCYRENLALFLNGFPMENILLHWMGDERGNIIPDDVRATPICVPIGTHPLHAAGIAWGHKLKKDPVATVCFFGDGATSEGDIHEALNFASALKLPVVFVCQNNFWAISVPRAKQTGSETFAQKGVGYGMPCYQVDGNDIFATYKIARDSIEFALKEQRPVFIEMVTYRLGDHTTADDARRYRDDAELEGWKAKDPLIRTRAYLESKKLWSDEKQSDLDARAKKLVEEIVKKAEGIEAPTNDDIFNYMFAEIPADLARQRDTMRTESLLQRPQQESLALR